MTKPMREILDALKRRPPKNPDRCCVPGCNGESYLKYCTRQICEKHWNALCKYEQDNVKIK